MEILISLSIAFVISGIIALPLYFHTKEYGKKLNKIIDERAKIIDSL